MDLQHSDLHTTLELIRQPDFVLFVSVSSYAVRNGTPEHSVQLTFELGKVLYY